MQRIKRTCCLLLAAALLAACGSRAPSESAPAEGGLPVEEVAEAPDSLLEQMEALYNHMDTAALPLKGADTYAALDSFDGGTQLVKDDADGKKLAGAVYNLLDAYGNGLGAYDGSGELSMAKTTTALFHTAPIDFSWELSREGDFLCGQSNHVLAALVKRELASGRTPVALYYADEVRKTAQRLFGSDVRVTNLDEPPYYYYEKEGVYILMEDLGKVGSLPQVLGYEKTSDGWTAEVLLAESDGTSLSYGGEPLTKENFAAVTAGAQRLRYTFRDEGGALILTKLETWRPEQG